MILRRNIMLYLELVYFREISFQYVKLLIG
jgi:hypothetical protein